MRDAGVTVFGGSDNIRDSWWPYGDGDMLGRANMIGYRSGFNTDDELKIAFDVVTEAGAKALRLEGYGLKVGDKADFVTLNARACAGGGGGHTSRAIGLQKRKTRGPRRQAGPIVRLPGSSS